MTTPPETPPPPESNGDPREDAAPAGATSSPPPAEAAADHALTADLPSAPPGLASPPAESAAPADAPATAEPPATADATAEPPAVDSPLQLRPAPERAHRRRRPGRFLGAALPAVAAVALLPAVVPLAMDPSALGSGGEDPAVVAARDDGAERALRASVESVRAQLREAEGPAAQLARVECKRAAYRGAALVDQEVRHLQQEGLHAQQLEAALARQPGLAQKEKPAPVNAAQLEPLARRVGLVTPEDGREGEVLVDTNGAVVGGALPPAFVPLLEAFAAGNVEADGRVERDGQVAWKARAAGGAFQVIAVRRLPAPVQAGALDDVLRHAATLVGAGATALQDASDARVQLRDARARARNTAVVALVAGLLAVALWSWLVRRHVMEPLRDLRDEVERVRAGQAPLPQPQPDALADLHAALADVAARMAAAQELAEQARARARALDDVMDACRRAELGELSARPRAVDGPEGLLALSVTHLLESLEQHAARVRVQARTVLENISAVGQLTAPSADAPAFRNPLDVMRQRLDSLAPLPNLIRNLAQRMGVLSEQADLAVVVEDLGRLSKALAPRAQAAAALLQDVEEQHRRLAEALTAGSGAGVSDALQRARDAAQDLARQALAWRGDGSIPTVLSAVRTLPPSEVQRAWRDGADLSIT